MRLVHVAQLIAKDALNDLEIMMEQQRRGLLLGFLTDVKPKIVEVSHIRADLFVGVAFPCRAHNKAAGDALPVRLQDFLQTLAFFVTCDLA